MTILSDITAQIQRFHTELIRVLSQSIAGQSILSALLDIPFLTVSSSAVLNAERVLTAGSNISFTDSGANGTFTINAIDSADKNAQYLTLASTASLNAERVLTPGTGLLGTDAGANSTYTLNINNNVIATVSGTTFTGPVSASAGLSGSLQNIGPNLTYLASGVGISIVTASSGQVTITNTATGSGGTGDGDRNAQYLTLANTASLSAERLFSASIGLTPNDGGANNTYSLRVDDNVIDTTASIVFLTAELDAISDQLELLTGSLSGSTGDLNASYLTLTTSSLLTNERVFTPGTGLSGSDGGAGNVYTLSINNNIVATVSGTAFTGPVSSSGGFTGSLQKINSTLSYLVAGENVTIASQSNGQIIISAATGSGGSSGSTASPISEFWATPATPHAIDDEFDDGVLASDWSMFSLALQTFITSSGQVAYFSPGPVTNAFFHTENATRNRSWLAIQASSTGSSNQQELALVRNCSASINAAGNEFVIRSRLRSTKGFGDNTSANGICFMAMFGDNGGKPHKTNAGGYHIQWGWLNASGQQSWFLERNINGTKTTLAQSVAEDDRKQVDIEFVLIRRNPDVYYAFLKSAGNSFQVSRFTATGSYPWLGFGFLNNATTAAPTPIVSIDYFRFEALTSSSFIP